MVSKKKVTVTTSIIKPRFAIVIPAYNHEQMIEDVIEKSLKLEIPVFVVDDGSTDSSYEKIKKYEGIRALQHQKNKGKGAALCTGFAQAAKIADWAITIDADGQHNPQDALRMIEAIPENQRPIVVGMRQGMTGKEVPWTSRFGRKFSNFWIVLAGGPRMADSQSGFRIYPLPESLKLNVIARRFQFEIEILVKAGWKKLTVIEVPVSVSYAPGKERISHFRPFIDFLRNTCTFARLIIQRILIHPFVPKS
ncbi:MAG: glycosyltransferase family 2 protein [Deltaproteobacteria bacterium]|nr:glycosyltransferase family 2 protein [Deltaproteobacteria bacterium]